MSGDYLFSFALPDIAKEFRLAQGIDRDSGTIAHLFDERNDAVLRMLAYAIEAADRVEKPIGICGQAASDYPEFAQWLVERGITSISLNPDVAIKRRCSSQRRRSKRLPPETD